MGSKNKIIHEIWNTLKDYEFNSFFDAFAGSNVVGYFMKSKGKEVITNDFMKISYITAKAIIENSNVHLGKSDVDFLLSNKNKENYISNTFMGLYFSDQDNQFLDKVRFNISLLDDEYKQTIALSSLVRACMKKRPRGIFTFVGHRYDDGRSDIKKSLENHFIDNVLSFNDAVFDNDTHCKANNSLTQKLNIKADLVYFDPPYFTPNSDNDYVRRYHFVEGLAKNWEGLEIQEHTKTKKFKSYKSPFSKKEETYTAFENLIKKYKNSMIAISYSSNSLPTKAEMIEILKKHKNTVVVHEIDHLYSFGNQNHKAGNGFNRVKEYIFIGN
ncbi:MAG: DNA adenine methylase [Candidatus Marinimicrobia bacterium]|nr:DNA adenine methylase [Candidatus Neomarinimicrobiota bacterium]